MKIVEASTITCCVSDFLVAILAVNDSNIPLCLLKVLCS